MAKTLQRSIKFIQANIPDLEEEMVDLFDHYREIISYDLKSSCTLELMGIDAKHDISEDFLEYDFRSIIYTQFIEFDRFSTLGSSEIEASLFAPLCFGFATSWAFRGI